MNEPTFWEDKNPVLIEHKNGWGLLEALLSFCGIVILMIMRLFKWWNK